MSTNSRRFRTPAEHRHSEPLVIEEQGSFAFGGTVVERADGTTVHADHGYVQYQIPPNAKKHAIVMWHGYGQSGRTWEMTPDGRDGFQTIFLRRGHPVYIIDQPRRGRAGVPSVGTRIVGGKEEEYFFTDQVVFDAFRLGVWEAGEVPKYHPGVQFPQEQAALAQYLRQGSISVGPDGFTEAERELFSDAVAALFDEIGPGILLAHSTCGSFGWRAATKSENVRGVVAYEPSPFAFPQSAPPVDVECLIPQLADWVSPDLIPDAQFDRLQEIPVQIVFGDNIEGNPEFAPYHARSEQFVELLRSRGGDAELLELTERGLRGNTHFPFSDLNNVVVADLLSEWLEAKQLNT